MRLDKCRVLITRPFSQAQKLADPISHLGGQAICVPAQKISQVGFVLPKYPPELIFCTSANAAKWGLSTAQNWQHLPVLAVGTATAKACRDLGFVDVNTPLDQSSEGLLKLFDQKFAHYQSAAMITGVGGRQTLEQGLIQRGVQVTRIESYQRQENPSFLEQLADYEVDIVQTSNGESLEVIAKAQKLLDKPLLLMHTRHIKTARQLGWTGELLVADRPSIHSQLAALCSWWESW